MFLYIVLSSLFVFSSIVQASTRERVTCVANPFGPSMTKKEVLNQLGHVLYTSYGEDAPAQAPHTPAFSFIPCAPTQPSVVKTGAPVTTAASSAFTPKIAKNKEKEFNVAVAFEDHARHLSEHSAKLSIVESVQAQHNERLNRAAQSMQVRQQEAAKQNERLAALEAQMKTMQQQLDQQATESALNARKLQEMQSSVSSSSKRQNEAESDSDSEDETPKNSRRWCCRTTARCAVLTTFGVGAIGICSARFFSSHQKDSQ